MEYAFSPLAVRWLLSISWLTAAAIGQEEITVQSQMPPPVLRIEEGEGLRRVELDGQLFAEYRFAGLRQPVLYPIMGVNGIPVTRSYPFDLGAGEERRDPHHQSLWFAHSDVSGVNFWTGEGGCRVEHLRFFPSKEANVIHSQNVWMDGKGKALCLDERRLRFGVEKSYRWIDYEMTFFASEGAVRFERSDKAGFGIRLASVLRVEGEMAEGLVTNSNGDRGEEVSSNRADWVDYSADLDGRSFGVAIFEHPVNAGHPTRWIAREDGLCVANPFSDSALSLAKGERATFRYRVLIHAGTASQAVVGDLYASFAEER